MRLVTGLQKCRSPKGHCVGRIAVMPHPLKLGGKVPAAKRIQRRNVALGRDDKSTNLRAPVWGQGTGAR